METFFWGAVGAIAPEIVRWWRIARSETPGEWTRASYWLATAAYLCLAGLMALLVAQPNPYAAFMAGLTAEFAIVGALKPGPSLPIEELQKRSANLWTMSLVAIRRHAIFLFEDA